jgi:hypothetical protein
MIGSTLDATTERALLDLDPARSVVVTTDDRARADRALAQILTDEPRGGGASGRDVLPRPGHHWVRVVAAVSAVAVLVVVAFLVSLAHRPGDRRGTEVPAAPSSEPTPTPLVTLTPPRTEVSWSATPEPVPPAVAETLARTCRSTQIRSVEDMGDPPESGVGRYIRSLRSTDLVLSEQRGGWIVVWLATADGANVACTFGDSTVPGPHDADGYVRGSSGGGLDGPPPTPSPDGLVAQRFAGTITSVGGSATTAGVVGADVSGVVVDVRDGRRVEATVENGRFLAWWPMSSDAFPDDVTYTVTLRDGTVLPPTPYSEAIRTKRSSG